jgi:hypothetical protein
MEFKTKPLDLVTRTEAYELVKIDKRLFKNLFDQVDGPKPEGSYETRGRVIPLYKPETVIEFFKMFKQKSEEMDEEDQDGWPVPASDFRLLPVFKDFIRSKWVNHELV